MSGQSARARAEQLLAPLEPQTTAGAILRASGRIGWGLLDVADAIREHAEASKPRPTGSPYVNRGGR